MLDPNPGLMIWTVITFVALMAVLGKFAWKPLLEALRKREEHVRTSIERAEQAREDAERILEENRKQLANAEREAQRILSEGRALGDKLKSEIVEQANQQTRRMVDQAKQEIDRDKEAALSQLRNEVANLAIGAAEKILDETLDEQKQRKLVDTYLKGLPKN
ncbi:MAG TPA: F0F1 ATP synthase subunit B [Bacteroidota bacterium]|nr:F0F1 ATP synthase subunit B [Bacteroidota bacterium]